MVKVLIKQQQKHIYVDLSKIYQRNGQGVKQAMVKELNN